MRWQNSPSFQRTDSICQSDSKGVTTSEVTVIVIFVQDNGVNCVHLMVQVTGSDSPSVGNERENHDYTLGGNWRRKWYGEIRNTRRHLSYRSVIIICKMLNCHKVSCKRCDVRGYFQAISLGQKKCCKIMTPESDLEIPPLNYLGSLPNYSPQFSNNNCRICLDYNSLCEGVAELS